MLIYIKNNFVTLNKQEIENYISDLPSRLKYKLENYKSIEKKQQRIAGLSLLKFAFNENKLIADFDLKNLKIDANGKPFINETIDFSLSYCKNNVVLAINPVGKIGIDIEEIKEINYTDFKDFFTANEFNFMKFSHNMNEIFFKLWTRKEAVAKAIGLGGFLDFKSLEVIDDNLRYNDTLININSELILEKFWLSTASI
ncbi:MAG: 4'-phosphopantetheinyl transferase superfamily protein [Flavobacterium sp.]|nr:4'-phosphopantetheinyl transferase superfamily protein [Flavobacterium sp.]